MSINVVIGAQTQPAVTGIDNVTKSLERLPASATKAQSALNKLPNASNAATMSMMNLGRVVQDAPFGFLGIANNLNPLIESFQRTGAAAGGFKGALGAIGKSLIGPGGIGLAVSAISTGLILFGDKLFGASKKAKDAEKSIKDLSDAMAKQVVSLTSLVGLINNVSSSYGDKQKALQAINQEYGSYLKNMGMEEVTLGNVNKAYEALIDNMIRQAVVKGIQDEITKAVEKTANALVSLEISEEQRRLGLNKTTTSFKETTAGQNQLTDAFNRFQQPAKDGNLAIQDYNQEVTGGLKGINDYTAVHQRLKDRLTQTLNPLLNLVTKFSDLGINLNKLKDDVVPGVLNALDKLAEGAFGIQLKLLRPISAQPLVDSIANSVEIADFDKVREVFNLQLFNQFDKAFKEIGAEIPDIDIKVDPVLNFEKLNTALAAEKLFKQFETDVNAAFANLQINTIEGLGAAIGEMLSGGDVGSAFKAFGAIIAEGLTVLGKQFIKVATLAQLAKSALKTLFSNPALALGAGIALIAAGAALKSSLSKGINARQAGGPVSAGRGFLVGENGPEFFVPSDTGRIVPNNSLGGIAGSASQNLALSGEFVVRGRDLVVLLARQNGYNLRNT